MATREMVEAAFLASLTAMLALVGVYVLPLSVIANLVWTIPIVLCVVRNGWRYGVMSLAVATLLIGLLTNLPLALLLLLQFGGLGLWYGVAFRRMWPAWQIWLPGSVIAALSVVAAVGLGAWLSGVSLEALQGQMQAAMEASLAMYRDSGALASSGLTEAQLREQLQAMLKLLQLLLPSFILIYGSVTAASTFLLTRAVLRRLPLPVPPLAPFAEWRLPWPFIWLVIAGLAGNLAGEYWSVEWLRVIGLNLLYVAYPLIFVLGLSVLTFFFRRIEFSPVLLGLGVFLAVAFLGQFVIIFIGTIGLMDMIFDYRQRVNRDA
ncbi:YybS family protein [Heliophilum fasciatum]|nr:DUF2232 domain-containing protein [Heliophilum fasciatum]MCW2278233.1 uncharacterized protein YybS (DUF2232 family) [Heliophilum fasciatum]